MNIPYTKVLIYSLTFLTYAYTGYGSSLLSTLRDAVLSAETIFGDVLQNVIQVAHKFKTFNDIFSAAVEEECVFKCPGGITPRKNKYHTPQSDGCGSVGLEISKDYLPLAEMTKCCDTHDICYDTCYSNKEACDLEFKTCLYRYCDTYTSTVGETVTKACKGAAKMLFTGTLTLGCKSFLDAQANACYCSENSKFNSKKKYTTGGEL